MSFPRWTLGAGLVLVLCALRVNHADQPQLSPRPGVLVLRTGRVLRGEIIRLGDRFVVTLGEQDEVGVPVTAVELHCDTLEAAYHRKREAISHHATAAKHLELADWCLRYELISSAAEQLILAQRLEPDNPANLKFERRLRLAARCASTPVTGSTPPSGVVSPAELDAFTSKVPPGTVERFTNTVQPLLINRCGAGNCHGPNSESSFRLAFPNWSRVIPRRFTQQNLRHVMQFVDSEQPGQSPLLLRSTRAHGGSDQPILDEHDTVQLQQLAAWVHQCAAGSSSTPSMNVWSPDAILRQLGKRRMPTFHPSAESDDQEATVAESNAAATGKIASGPPSTNQPGHSQQHSAGSGATAGRDPFDPEIFNRRYLKRKH
jgi:hypothetical protein